MRPGRFAGKAAVRAFGPDGGRKLDMSSESHKSRLARSRVGFGDAKESLPSALIEAAIIVQRIVWLGFVEGRRRQPARVGGALLLGEGRVKNGKEKATGQ